MKKICLIFLFLIIPTVGHSYYGGCGCGDITFCDWPCDTPYLEIIGPSPMRFVLPCRGVDRLQLVSIAAIEADQQKKAAAMTVKEHS